MSPQNHQKNSSIERSFFDYLPKEKLNEIIKEIKTIVLPAGTVIFRQGDPGDNFYLIRSGKIRAFRTNEEGVETDLGILGPGDGFGELALLTGNPRSASAETVEETVLSVLPKEKFDQILKEYPLVALCFVNHMTKLLLQDWGKLEEKTKEHYQAPRISWLDFVLIFGVTVICALTFNFANPQGIRLIQNTWSDEPIAAVTPAEANLRYQTGKALFIDARPSNFYNEEHISGALNLPAELFDIVYLMEQENIKQAQEIIVYGRTISSLYYLQVADKLRLRGHTNVSILAGDLSAWKKKGYPVAP